MGGLWSMGKNVITDKNILNLQYKLYCRSKNDKKCRFSSLFDKVCKDNILREAWKHVRAKKGAPGIDGQTIWKIEKNNEDFLKTIKYELKTGTYKSSATRRIWIKKKDGNKRALGIPTVKDRVVQTAVKMVIEPIFEADFRTHSYGFRPKRNRQQAITEIKKYLEMGLINVLETDIEDLFNRIPHEKLLSIIKLKVVDGHILKLIKMWLKCGVVEDKQLQVTNIGMSQGGCISPLLANIYLNEMDKWWETKYTLDGNVQMIRYADDLVILAKTDVGKLISDLKGELGYLKLIMKEKKTRVLQADKGNFDFLGFNISMNWNNTKTERITIIRTVKKAQVSCK